ncbi:MAG: NPCBM/NEW2 domain-containing protein [Verrucomicrobiota bacterium]|jgi:alpha-galactosidase
MKTIGRVTTLTILTGFALLASAAETVWLSTLDLSQVRQGWGKANADRSVTGKPLSIAGKKFDHGVGTHAPGTIWVDLAGGSERFLAFVGVDDAAKSQAASITFKVLGDGRTLWQSSLMKGGQSAQSVDVDVTGIQKLVLLVGNGGDGNDNDHANWAEARFVVSSTRPKTCSAPREEAVILTPKPEQTPQINGAFVFGVRPGSPFLFTIPATGARPMLFRAENLPAGLELDASSGQITGSIEKRGEYQVILRVYNKLGSAGRDFTIVCGDRLALTPPMGWNSWYIWENHVTDQIIRDAADAMVKSGMIDHGYMYVNIDDCWAVKPGSNDPSLSGEPRDPAGKVNANKRFPDMKALTDYIHARGLKAGIYTGPGPTTRAGHVGAYQHEEADAQRFVEWGFDFLKYDWGSYGGVAKDNSREELEKPYRLMGQILAKQPRDVVLNLCQYGMGKVWEWGKAVGGHSWRTAGDLGGTYEGMGTLLFQDGFDLYAHEHLDRYGGPGGWNDPDYLLLGYLSNGKGQTAPTPLTPNEQYSHVSLWCLLAAPLIFSGDMTRLDEFTLSLLTNDQVINVDQDPLGQPGQRVSKTDDLEVWAKPMTRGSKAVGLFNRGEFPATVTAKWSDLGLTGACSVWDLWRQKDLGQFKDQFQAQVPRHGVVLVRIYGR